MRAELTVGVYIDCRNRSALIDPINPGDIGKRLSSLAAKADCVGLVTANVTETSRTDVNIVTAIRKIVTGINAHRDIGVAKVRIGKCPETNGCVVAATCVARRLITNGIIEGAGCIAIERIITSGRVAATGGVAKERIYPIGCVVAGGGVARERVITTGRVVVAGALLKSAESPVAVLSLPVALLKSA